jgi:hypothetical protein
MKTRGLLLLPLLSPLLAVLLVATLNPGPRLTFRVLTWESPKAPLGLWLAAAALGGAALSGGAAGLALRQGAGHPGRRGTTTRDLEREPWFQEQVAEERWRGMEDGPRPTWRRESQDAPATAPWREPGDVGRAAPGVSVAPARAPGDPAPTVVVPFRVLRRPGSPAAAEGAPAPVFRAQPASAQARESMPVAATDDWGDTASAEEW